ncbi:hypothetical protein cand_035180 [Cryptosporidium andersoni]|uniref:Uncharacterized protein n=1 Tax=Cryptosporidium andersoni TaxID=117008 RepID=A0A1J4MZ02_9CRYT|nr:hypothetical protein cand_035180 [Cryptosporidium andersoni]
MRNPKVDLNLESLTYVKKRKVIDDDIEQNNQKCERLNSLELSKSELSSKESSPCLVNKSSRSRRVIDSDESSDSFSNSLSRSSTDSDSSSSNSDDVSSSEREQFKNRKASINKVRKVTSNLSSQPSSILKNKEAARKRTSKKKDGMLDDDNNLEGTSIHAYVPRRDRDRKQILVAAVLCRWWHALPDWPPPDMDYNIELQKNKLRLVDIDDWEDAVDIDDNGYAKVYQLSNYPGVFRDYKGVAHDLRPIENKPCYSNLIKMDEDKLYDLLITALRNQIKTLQSQSIYSETALIEELEKELFEVEALVQKNNLKHKT